eukprot:9615828-Lingulodinium_polyedra.AAC.1
MAGAARGIRVLEGSMCQARCPGLGDPRARAAGHRAGQGEDAGPPVSRAAPHDGGSGSHAPPLDRLGAPVA